MLTEGGQLLLEPQTCAHIKSSGQASPSWHSSDAGLFSDEPHLLLQESFWDESIQTSTIRFYVVDATTGATARHALSNVAYGESELESLLLDAGFQDVRVVPSLSGVADEAEPSTMVLLANK